MCYRPDIVIFYHSTISGATSIPLSATYWGSEDLQESGEEESAALPFNYSPTFRKFSLTIND